MSNYRRAKIPGGTYFFTVVTFNRRPLFNNVRARQCLRQAISEVRLKRSFKIEGICLLPDHLHTIWRLPKGDQAFSQRWNEIKSRFSKRFQILRTEERRLSRSRLQSGEVDCWQRRFWEHLIKDELDFRNHMDYLHYNPVKHGYVKSVVDGPGRVSTGT